ADAPGFFPPPSGGQLLEQEPPGTTIVLVEGSKLLQRRERVLVAPFVACQLVEGAERLRLGRIVAMCVFERPALARFVAQAARELRAGDGDGVASTTRALDGVNVPLG